VSTVVVGDCRQLITAELLAVDDETFAEIGFEAIVDK
jgi:hypothetical protein